MNWGFFVIDNMKEIKITIDKTLKERAKHLIPEKYCFLCNNIFEDDNFIVYIDNKYNRSYQDNTSFRKLIIEKRTQHYLILTQTDKISKANPSIIVDTMEYYGGGRKYKCNQVYNSNLGELNASLYLKAHLPQYRYIVNFCDTMKLTKDKIVNLIACTNSYERYWQYPLKICDYKIISDLSFYNVREYLNNQYFFSHLTTEEILLYFDKLYTLFIENDFYLSCFNIHDINYDIIKDIKKICQKYVPLNMEYVDYRRMLSSRCIPIEIKKRFPKYPKESDIIRYHNEITREWCKYNYRDGLEKQQERYEQYEYNRIQKLEFNNDKYFIIAPKKLEELLFEGKKLNHCVGSYTSSVSSGNDIILFLRKDIDTPWITINLNSNYQFRQIHGENNCNLSSFEESKEIVKFLKEWIEIKKLDLNSFKNIDHVCCHL